MKQTTVIALAIAAALAAPAAASAQATLSVVDPVAPCYRELSDVSLVGQGFTPNAPVAFSRAGRSLGGPIPADASGQVSGTLTLPDLVSGQQQLTYLASDTTNTAITSQISLLVSATDVGVKPSHGPPNRLLTIAARGFIGNGKTLWAHVVKKGKKAGTAHNARIGRLKGACKTLKAKKRLFAAGAAPGAYRVQFDNFRKYQKSRVVKVVFSVTVYRTVQPAAATTGWRRIG